MVCCLYLAGVLKSSGLYADELWNSNAIGIETDVSFFLQSKRDCTVCEQVARKKVQKKCYEM